MNPDQRAWLARRTDDGSWTLHHPVHGEACHSLAGAWTQARQRYASVIADLPQSLRAAGRVRLLDIGTGLGLNLAAALEACESLGLSLEATSLEIDPTVLRCALLLAQREAPCSIEHRRVLDVLALELASADSKDAASGSTIPGPIPHRLRWIRGDARTTLRALPSEPCFDAVFLDPFSPRVDPPLWDEVFLAQVAERMAPGARLSTYTTSFRVRAALARAGLAVGEGPRVGRKAAGTLAARGGSVPPLDERTRRKLDRALAAQPPAGQK